MSKEIEVLIDDLSADLAPVKKQRHPLLRVALWAVPSLLFTALIISVAGLRPDIMIKLDDPSFLLEITLVAAMTISAGISAFFLCIPDMRGKGWLPVVPLAFVLCFVLWNMIRTMTEGFDMPEIHLEHCVTGAAAFVLVPAILMTFMTARKNATTRPVMLAVMNVLTVSGIGYLGLRFICMVDNISHNLIYHIMPFLIIGTALGLIARRLYRW